eukprot:750096-Hanusia_phi.AAC.3
MAGRGEDGMIFRHDRRRTSTRISEPTNSKRSVGNFCNKFGLSKNVSARSSGMRCSLNSLSH